MLDETYDKDSTPMKIFKRIGFVILFLVIIVVVFRGWIYRNTATYKSVGLREKFVITNSTLLKLVDENVAKQNLGDISSVIKSSLSLTSRHLTFTDSDNELDPNKLVTSRTAHCIGYANFYSTICNYLIKKNNLSQEWEATARIGHIYVFGKDIHSYFKSPFFKDHDFVVIENKISGEVFAVDPTLHDYSGIKLVSYQLE